MHDCKEVVEMTLRLIVAQGVAVCDNVEEGGFKEEMVSSHGAKTPHTVETPSLRVFSGTSDRTVTHLP